MADAKELKVNGGIVTVDADLYDTLSKFAWCVDNKGYVKLTVYLKDEKRDTTIRMSQMVMGIRPGYILDHINRNPLDNRKSNLRWVTRQENYYNSARADRFYKAGRLKNPQIYERIGLPSMGMTA